MHPFAARLSSSILAALPGYLEGRLGDLGVDPADHRAALQAATERARSGLAELLALPFDRQHEAPLEIVRRAVAPISGALREAGVDPPGRPPEAGRVAPDDAYGLAPASAAELGERALESSLAWGAAKADALSRPTALVVTSSLLDGSRFEGPVTGAGYRLEVSPNARCSTTPLVAFVDLEADNADGAVGDLAGEGTRVVAYGPHVDDLALTRARSLGAAVVEPRSRVLRDPAAFLPPLV